jgi:hypothetical protein
MARLGADMDEDGELSMLHTIDWMNRFLAVRWSKLQRPLPVSHVTCRTFPEDELAEATVVYILNHPVEKTIFSGA